MTVVDDGRGAGLAKGAISVFECNGWYAILKATINTNAANFVIS